MKKVLLLSLFAGTLAFAGTVKPKKTVKKVKTAKKEVVFHTCTVGEFTVSSQQVQNPCDYARELYCHAHPGKGACDAQGNSTIHLGF